MGANKEVTNKSRDVNLQLSNNAAGGCAARGEICNMTKLT